MAVVEHDSAEDAAEACRPLAVARNLEKRYRRRGSRRAKDRSASMTYALRGVGLTIGPGAMHGIVGESGSGKTTLARCLCGLEQPSGGEVELLGDSLIGLRPSLLREKWRHVQMVFQNPYATLDPRMLISDIVREPLDNFHIGDPNERDEYALAALSDVGISSNLAARKPAALSGGQRQRVAIARALVLSPRLVFMDEPVSALDVSVQAQVLKLIRDLQQTRSTAFVIILHDLAVARQICHTISVMHNGNIVETGDSESVLQNPQDDYTKALLEAAPVVPPG